MQQRMDSYVCGIDMIRYELRKYSHLVISTFCVINKFLSNSGTPILREK